MKKSPILFFVIATLLTNSLFGQTGGRQHQPTAREIVTAIQHHLDVPWTEPNGDIFHGGDPDTPVTGIAVTMMSTMDVLQRAAARGENLIITHEPTFYADETPEIDKNDAVWKEKRDFIEKNHLVVWRFHAYWHAMKPDGIQKGMTRALGWTQYQNADDPTLFSLPETTLRALAESVAKKLNSPVVRVVGDPAMRVHVAALSPGFSGITNEVSQLEKPQVDVVVVGESREWETVEYAADAVSEGKKKALIILGHIPSEQAGMEDCAEWLKGFIKDVPIAFVPAKQPFWIVPLTASAH